MIKLESLDPSRVSNASVQQRVRRQAQRLHFL